MFVIAWNQLNEYTGNREREKKRRKKEIKKLLHRNTNTCAFVHARDTHTHKHTLKRRTRTRRVPLCVAYAATNFAHNFSAESFFLLLLLLLRRLFPTFLRAVLRKFARILCLNCVLCGHSVYVSYVFSSEYRQADAIPFSFLFFGSARWCFTVCAPKPNWRLVLSSKISFIYRWAPKTPKTQYFLKFVRNEVDETKKKKTTQKRKFMESGHFLSSYPVRMFYRSSVFFHQK